MSRQSLLFWFGLAFLLVVVGVLGGRQRTEGPPLDPASTGPLGTKALTELVAEFGGEVRRGLPDDDTRIALVLADRMSDDERQRLEQWVEGGGRLVVADPGSSLSPGLADLVTSDELERGSCRLVGVEDVDTLSGGSFARYRSDGFDQSCFGTDGLAYAVSDTLGAGRIVSLGGAVIFVNQNLGQADNAVLAVNLLAEPGAELAIIYDPGAVGGDRTLSDLIPPSVQWAGWQLVVAFAVYVLWRARRFGRVVAEPQKVEMPGSLLVRASGELGRRAGGHAAAGERLRRDLERRLRVEYRLPPDLTLAEVIAIVARRSGVSSGLLGRTLAGPPPENGTDLTRLVIAVDDVAAGCFTSLDPPDLAAPPAGSAPRPEPSTNEPLSTGSAS